MLMMQAICLPPGRVQVGVHSPIFPPPGFMTPDRSTVTLLPNAQEGLQDQQISLARASRKSSAFALRAGVHETLCAPSRSGASVSHHPHPCLWSTYSQAPLAFKARSAEGSSIQCQAPRLGSLMWNSELSALWENFCDVISL